MKRRAAIALVLGAILALVLSASASAASPFPKIKRAHELSCSGAKAKLALTITWRKANRRGKHEGHAVALVRGKRARLLSRKVKSEGLRRVRSQSIEYRFRFPKRASARLCSGKSRAEVVASHGQNKDGKGLVEIYRVARRTLGANASANGRVGAAGVLGASGSGRPDPEVIDAGGPDCTLERGGLIAVPGAQLQGCDFYGSSLPRADLAGANLTDAGLYDTDLTAANLTAANLTAANLTDADLEIANLTDAILTGANLTGANLTGANLFAANLTDANLTDADLIGAQLPDANLTDADLTDADLTDADLFGANLTGATFTSANCWGAKKPGGSKYPAPGSTSFVQC